jgi:hypothetical protein
MKLDTSMHYSVHPRFNSLLSPETRDYSPVQWMLLLRRDDQSIVGLGPGNNLARAMADDGTPILYDDGGNPNDTPNDTPNRDTPPHTLPSSQ